MREIKWGIAGESALGFGFWELELGAGSSAAGGGVGLASRFPRGGVERRVVCAGALHIARGGGGGRRDRGTGKRFWSGTKGTTVKGKSKTSLTGLRGKNSNCNQPQCSDLEG